MLLYNTECRYDHGMVANYSGKKFYNIGPRVKIKANPNSLNSIDIYGLSVMAMGCSSFRPVHAGSIKEMILNAKLAEVFECGKCASLLVFIAAVKSFCVQAGRWQRHRQIKTGSVQSLSLLTNIRLGWKFLYLTNTLT
jgi:hypothetical protein